MGAWHAQLMRLSTCSLLTGLAVLPALATSACLGDVEHTGGASGAAGYGGESPNGHAGAPASSGGMMGQAGDSSSGGNSGVPLFPRVVTSDTEPCSITLTRAALSPYMNTVGAIGFESSWPAPDSAKIVFGKTESYGLEAPVTMSGAHGDALLLGMTTMQLYHYRIVVVAGGETCQSEDLTLMSGPMPNGVGIGHAVVSQGTSTAPISHGYFIGANYNGNWIFILDSAGELVWYYESSLHNISSVRLAPDGRHVFARMLNVARKPEGGRLAKIAIDGSSEEEILLTSSHHDFNFGPEGSIVYIRKSASNTCDSIYLHWLDQPDDSQDELIADLDEFFTVQGPNGMLSGESCHANSVHHQLDGGYTVSELVHNAYVKVDELGELEWMLGGGVDSTFSGSGNVWSRQHGHHFLPPDRLLFFNNQTAAEDSSRALEVVLDFGAGIATYAPFEYAVAGLASQVLGDVRRLPNGNTLVTYSVGSGLLHEVDPDGRRVRAIDLPGGACGYTDFRESLYPDEP